MTATPRSPAARSAPILIVGVAWLLVAAALGATGRLQALHPPAPQVILLGLTALLLIASLGVASFRRWIAALPIRALVAMHLVRLVAGSAFLFFHARGELPASFALPSGWGDIAVAVLAGVLLLTVAPATPSVRRMYFVWNVLGFVDIVFVVINAARTGMADPVGMATLLRLPLSLLPTFVVPVIIVSHVVLALRLSGRWRA